LHYDPSIWSLVGIRNSNSIESFPFALRLFSYRLQNILKLTHTFVVSYDELCEECQGKATNPQRPEYLEHKFDENFRFSTKCAYDNCDQWAKDTRYNMILSDRIWNGLYDRVFKSKPVNRN